MGTTYTVFEKRGLIMSRFALALAVLLAAAPARAYDSDLFMRHRNQVEQALVQLVFEESTDRVWKWPDMVDRCTRELMLTSSEQNENGQTVRFTENALLQLVFCAKDKGFTDRPGVLVRK